MLNLGTNRLFIKTFDQYGWNSWW